MVSRTLWLLGMAFVLPALGWPPTPPGALADPIAVVTQRQNTTEGLSMDQLRRLYLGRATTWPNGQPVVLFELAMTRDAFYRQVLGLSAQIVRQRWIAISFRGEPGTPPREVATVAELLRLVSETPGALAFLPATDATSAIQVLSIDGAVPSDPTYPIQAAP